MSIIRQFFRLMLTGKDNHTFDVVRVVIFFGSLTYMGASMYMVVAYSIWEPVNYGIGLTTLLGGGAAGLAVKHKTEPGCDDNPPPPDPPPKDEVPP